MPQEDITRDSVLRAVEDFDKLGQDQFLEQHGLSGRAKSRTTWLIYNENRYDAKAIVRVAHAYARPDLGILRNFHGGLETKNILNNLGFVVDHRGAVSPPTGQTREEAFDPKNIEDAREWIEQAIVRRQGQGEFRRDLLRAYRRKCAITSFSEEDVLEAAHIVPYLGPDTNKTSNGLLLRSDLHTLFDRGSLAIDPKTMEVRLAPRLRKGGYKKLHKHRIRTPKILNDRPSKKALAWHLKKCRKIWKINRR